jgi:hypothetical protein
MFDEKGIESNMEPRQMYKISNQENVELGKNMAAHSTGMVVLQSVTLFAIHMIIMFKLIDTNTHNKTDENSD